MNATMVRAAVGSRAAAAVDPVAPVVVAAEIDADARAMARRLEAVGFRRLLGILAGGIAAWRTADLPLDSIESVSVAELSDRLRREEVLLLDVRDPDEWASGHVPGSVRIPYQELNGEQLERLRASADGLPVAVACAAGNRAGLAASVLRRAGIPRVVHVAGGGIADLERHDVTLVKEEQ